MKKGAIKDMFKGNFSAGMFDIMVSAFDNCIDEAST